MLQSVPGMDAALAMEAEVGEELGAFAAGFENGANADDDSAHDALDRIEQRFDELCVRVCTCLICKRTSEDQSSIVPTAVYVGLCCYSISVSHFQFYCLFL